MSKSICISVPSSPGPHWPGLVWKNRFWVDTNFEEINLNLMQCIDLTKSQLSLSIVELQCYLWPGHSHQVFSHIHILQDLFYVISVIGSDFSIKKMCQIVSSFTSIHFPLGSILQEQVPPWAGSNIINGFKCDYFAFIQESRSSQNVTNCGTYSTKLTSLFKIISLCLLNIV